MCHGLSRNQLTNVKVSAAELKLMSDQLVGFSGARLAEGSRKEADMGWAHWMSFCSRFHKPIFLNSETQVEKAAAAAQAQLFLC